MIGPDNKTRPTYRDNGQIVVYMAVVFPLLMMLFMLLIDFGGTSLTYHRAQIALDSAAFAASQEIDLEEFYANNRVYLDPARAPGAAGIFATGNGRDSVKVTGIYVYRDQVTVMGIAEYNTVFAHFIGIPVVRMEVSSSSAPAYGIDERWQ